MKMIWKILKTIFYILVILYIAGMFLYEYPPDTRTKYIDDGRAINIIVDGKDVGTVE